MFLKKRLWRLASRTKKSGNFKKAHILLTISVFQGIGLSLRKIYKYHRIEKLRKLLKKRIPFVESPFSGRFRPRQLESRNGGCRIRLCGRNWFVLGANQGPLDVDAAQIFCVCNLVSVSIRPLLEQWHRRVTPASGPQELRAPPWGSGLVKAGQAGPIYLRVKRTNL